MKRKVLRLLGVRTMYTSYYQHKTVEGKYINDVGKGYNVKGVFFNGAKIKAVFRDDKILALKYIVSLFKDVCKNIIYCKRIDNRKILLE